MGEAVAFGPAARPLQMPGVVWPRPPFRVLVAPPSSPLVVYSPTPSFAMTHEVAGARTKQHRLGIRIRLHRERKRREPINGHGHLMWPRRGHPHPLWPGRPSRSEPPRVRWSLHKSRGSSVHDT